MKKNLVFAVAALALAGLVGCRSSSSAKYKPTPVVTSYEYAGASSDKIIVVPQPSKIVELTKPEVSTNGNSVVVYGTVRLRTGKYNPDAVVRIVVVDRRGNEADEIRAVLSETDSLGVLTYRAHFGPIPPKGSTVLLSYDDYLPVANYASTNIGSGGAGTSGAAVKNGSQNGGGGKISKPTYGGPTKQGSRGPR